MRTTTIIAGLMMATTPFLMTSCKGKGGGSEKSAQAAVQDDKAEKEKADNYKKLEELNHSYSKIPENNILDNGDGTPLYQELKKRYSDDVAKLKQSVEASGAKLVFVLMSAEASKPEKGGHVPNTTRYGNPAIKSICAQQGIECIDFSPMVAQQDVFKITQVPRDGHWSKDGAIFFAGLLEPIIKRNYSNTSKTTYTDAQRSATFGDLSPDSDEILDGGKDMPYHVKANSQGVRMDHNVTFPKKKKHILLMGDSGIFCPFLNNEFTIASVLQQRLPDAEVMNVGIIGYTMNDYVSLWDEKAKYSEPDIVIVQTNGGDIIDYFFSNRNILSRTHKPFYPSANEEAFYKKNYPTNE